MAEHGISLAKPKVDLKQLRGWKDGVVSQLTGGLSGLAKGRKVKTVQGYGKFVSANMIDFQPPAWPPQTSMVITKEPSQPWANDYHVKFEERDMKDILAYDDGFENEKEFEYVARFSELNDALYQAFFSSWAFSFRQLFQRSWSFQTARAVSLMNSRREISSLMLVPSL